MSSETTDTIKSICNVSSSRALELLDAAGGSVERAVEIHLQQHDNTSQQQPASKSTFQTPQKNTEASPQVSSSKRKTMNTPCQNTLLSFFSPRQGTKRPKAGAKPNSEISIDRSAMHASNNLDKKPTPAEARQEKQMSAAEDDDDKYHSASASLPFSILAGAFAEMIATTKRTVKTNALIKLFTEIIEHVGGVHDGTNRQEDAVVLVRAIDLILGKLSASSSSNAATSNDANDAIILQVSGSAVSAAVQSVTGVSRQELSNVYRKSGDLGDVAASLFLSTRQKQFFTTFTKPQAPLSILKVHEQLRAIANVSAGKGSKKERLGLLVKLMRRACDKEEMRFLVRILLGNMRLGATIKTVLVALATAVEQVRSEMDSEFVALPNPTKSLEKVFNICPRLDKVSAALLTGGVPCAVDKCSVEINYPIQPMLADPVHSFKEIEMFLTATDGTLLTAVAEYKYDGVRCQAHYDGKAIRLFSRNMLENTAQYPDAVQYMLEAKSDDVNSFIIDAEIVGVAADERCSDGFRLLPFQDLSTRRGTKLSEDTRIAVRVYAFDLMSLNGQSLLDLSLKERQSILKRRFCSTMGFTFAKSTTIVGFREPELQITLQKSIDDGAEGLMLKLSGLGTLYESGTRSKTWKKVKKDYLGAFADTIDVVPIGAWFGNGRKAQKGFLSPILLAVYDDEEGVYRSISRCMSFTDAMYSAMREFYFRGTPYPPDMNFESPPTLDAVENTALGDGIATELDARVIDVADHDEEAGVDVADDVASCNANIPDERVNCFLRQPPSSIVVTNETPPIWFKPLEVFEVSFADLSLSKAHSAAAGLIEDDQGRGVALRFPRFKRRRPDKLVEQATTCSDIARLFSQQSKMKGNNY
ncbi:hypothetical protein MPSEU_000878200 [Mayamaea pseudoterrestris]|nr:hypothetical protein MPSEU_000878200 [Mayamaea pseudoterrestris]